MPKEIAESMMVREGDELYLTATSEGMTATPFDPDFDETLEDARSFMRTHRNAFKKLAE
ncbi:MAG: AbrB/MazE/SpoVT family DNA-binding domain-containing protein [Bacteroidota bacterium]